MKLSEELTWRGLVNQTTYPDITALDGEPISFYWGVDPSANSMTIGNLAAAMLVKCLIRYGHKPVLLVGGATGLIGDPDGKSEERSLKSPDEIEKNKQAIVTQYKQIFGGQELNIVDNYDWFRDMRYLDFLREVGKHVPLRQMLARDFVQSRLGDKGAGISYAEFSYVLIQAYDFLTLYKDHQVSLQVCGADQWGNSVAGVDLIRRITGGEAHVYSVPLIIDKTTGQKFGKSEAGAIWLDATKTSTYQFYQNWLNVDDDSALNYLKIFTELDKAAIDDISAKFNDNRGQRLAQKMLAYEVTKLVHGQEAAESQKRLAEVLFGSTDALELSVADYTALEKELPVADVPRHMSQEDLTEALVKTGLATSKTEARHFLASGAIYINNQPVSDKFLFDSGAGGAVLRRGKNVSAVLKIR